MRQEYSSYKNPADCGEFCSVGLHPASQKFSVMNSLCWCKCLMVASRIGSSCKCLARQLGLDEAVIEREEARCNQDLKELAVRCLYTWRRLLASKATVDSLQASLQKVGRCDVAEELVELSCCCCQLALNPLDDVDLVMPLGGIQCLCECKWKYCTIL
eukprot:m.39185 g.39185  ORF g.39185 m.39185 type:complete len:158 (+) comp32684_c0_seq1:1150-1623(+)